MRQEFTTNEILGYAPKILIQISMFDRDFGSIDKVCIDDGKVTFYWNFWDSGWYEQEDLRDEAKPLAERIIKAIKQDGLI